VERRESASNIRMARTVLPPHLVESNGVKGCSVCAQQFDATSTPSTSVAFKKHVQDVHRAKVDIKRAP
jgi:hypothetical protein